MTTAGLYETSGDWLYDVGLPGQERHRRRDRHRRSRQGWARHVRAVAGRRRQQRQGTTRSEVPGAERGTGHFRVGTRTVNCVAVPDDCFVVELGATSTTHATGCARRSGHPALGERRHLELVRCAPGALLGEELDRPPRAREGRRAPRPAGPEQPRRAARYLRRRSGAPRGCRAPVAPAPRRSSARGRRRSPPPTGRARPSARRAEPPVTWITVAGPPCASRNEPVVERNVNAARAGAAAHGSNASAVASLSGPPPNGPLLSPP